MSQDRIFVWPTNRSVTTRKSTTRLVVHCTATREGNFVDATTVDKWHRDQKWAGIGYHYLIRLDGTIEAGRPINAVGSHVAGFNSNSISIVYVGGLDKQGVPKDTRTYEQKASMKLLRKSLLAQYRTIVDTCGHRDLSPDKDGDGVVEKHEWLKACPCFSVRDEVTAGNL